MQKERVRVIVVCCLVVFSLMCVASTYGSTMNAGISITDGFPTSWTKTDPDVTTTISLSFKTGTNFYLDPSAVSGDFYWDGSGTQPDYTMDPNASILQYAGHIGGSTNSLTVGNLPSYTNGQNFLTWTVDVPSTGGTDTIHFDLTSEQILSTTTTINGSLTTKNLTLNLLGYASDDLNHWSSSYSLLNLTVSETISSGNYTYSWAGTWASPAGGTVPEPATAVLLGLGMTFAGAYYAFGRRGSSGAGLLIIL